MPKNNEPRTAPSVTGRSRGQSTSLPRVRHANPTQTFARMDMAPSILESHELLKKQADITLTSCA